MSFSKPIPKERFDFQIHHRHVGIVIGKYEWIADPISTGPIDGDFGFRGWSKLSVGDCETSICEDLIHGGFHRTGFISGNFSLKHYGAQCLPVDFL
jgi:hypothetical protein